MSQLTPQEIQELSINGFNLILPFKQSYRHELSGLSGGLSCAGYDVHLDNVSRPMLPNGDSVFLAQHHEWQQEDTTYYDIPPGCGILGSTLERFQIPDNLVMKYFNKSTLARWFINAAATLAEPGWSGHLTLEILNSTDKHITLIKGQPIGQVVFEQLTADTQYPYRGKYQHQEAKPISGIQ